MSSSSSSNQKIKTKNTKYITPPPLITTNNQGRPQYEEQEDTVTTVTENKETNMFPASFDEDDQESEQEEEGATMAAQDSSDLGTGGIGHNFFTAQKSIMEMDLFELQMFANMQVQYAMVLEMKNASMKVQLDNCHCRGSTGIAHSSSASAHLVCMPIVIE
jgi:hypothetical protein